VTRPAAQAWPALRLRSAGLSHAGAVRAYNEDRFLDRPQARLWAVADGMGGHSDGEAASALAVERLAGLEDFGSGYAFLNAAEAALRQANAELLARSAALPPGAITGTTIVALLIHDDHAACLWAGDSRAYRLRGGSMQRLTRDHSLAQHMIDAGLGETAARTRRNVITRALGADAVLDLDRTFVDVLEGDRFLLCSDGLTGALDEDEIARLLGEGGISGAADALLARALERAPKDNVTVVCVEAFAG
jgi:serine/threonine protein phosphatase PrpC